MAPSRTWKAPRWRTSRIIHGVPVGEVRGISNIVTNRDTKTWRVKEAAVAAQEACARRGLARP